VERLFSCLFIASILWMLVHFDTLRHIEKRDFYFCESKSSGKITRPLSREEFFDLSKGPDFETSYTCEVKQYTRAEIDALFSFR